MTFRGTSCRPVTSRSKTAEHERSTHVGASPMVDGEVFGRLPLCSCRVCSDASKKINGRKSLIVTNTQGLLLGPVW
jgi:hypothetical protein